MTPTIALATAIVYITSAIAIAVMRKQDIGKKGYLLYVLYVIAICVAYTAFVWRYTRKKRRMHMFNMNKLDETIEYIEDKIKRRPGQPGNDNCPVKPCTGSNGRQIA